MPNRWWIYQRERFPVLAHGLLIGAFSFSALCYSACLRGQTRLPGVLAATVSFATTLVLFLQLRIADEFKDYDEDRRFRPYRPVPRGLVSLRELAVVAALGAALQLVLALLLEPALVLLLAVVWTYLALMSKEFFVGPWLRARPALYLLSHMVIIPLIDLYATACDWLPAGSASPWGLGWFLAVSYFDGIVLEMGRKIRAPEDEEPGVNTYTAVWGARRAVLAWMGALAVMAGCAAMAAQQIGFTLPVAIMMSILGTAAALVGWRFLGQPDGRRAKWIEALSGVWTVLMYLSLGAAPLLLRSLTADE
jgi:4-hydroxybenzoate polyprenyltransferase